MALGRLALVLTLAVGSATITGWTTAAKLPAGAPRCTKAEVRRADSGCLRAAIEATLPLLRGGQPRLGLPPLEPLLIQELTISQGGDGPISLALTFRDFATTDLTTARMLSASIDLDKMTLDAETFVGRCVATGQYSAKGRVLVLPVSGNGTSRVVLYNTTSQWHADGKRVTKNGKDYLEVTSASIVLNPKKMEMQFDNLFNGEAELGKAMNRVLNENWQLVWREIGSSFNEAYSKVVEQHARSLFQHVALDDIFPDKL
ncbi:hypothetical protein ONE63_005705 [Megalurothrips usitatus]|uniref:Protein takeout-like n=1 Tax=Megalurothrips usitatus TaxID=439358 RepID=A0AAV7XWE0_9NEOP|nr:hypothetical protein ONE63_005705 [Megalurothrips usitatus]